MQYRKMPKNGDRLSALGYGCMRLPVTKEGKIDEMRAVNQIRSAIDQGVNYLDTAWPYHAGQSEIVLGHALMDGYREKVKVATKLPSWEIKTRKDMDRYLNAQLEKLGVDYIDYYMLHALNKVSWEQLDALGVRKFLDRAFADGRIRNAGFSFHGAVEDFKIIVDGYPWTFCQIQYNFLDQQNQAGTEGMVYAAKRDLGIIVMEPLRGGNLGLPDQPAEVKAIWDRADKKCTPAEWALRWVWNHPEVIVVLSGMNDETHIKQNLEIAETALPGSLSETELKLIDEAAHTYGRLMKVGCTGCGYCMPCPSGVMIPGIFEVVNKIHLFGEREIGMIQYALRMSGTLSGTDPGYASLCIACGECVAKCPQGIDIPDVLQDIAEEMEDENMEKRLAMAKKMLALDNT